VRVFDRWATWPQAEQGLQGRVTPGDLEVLRRAFAFASACHGAQRRPTGEPYERHLLEALEILVEGAGVLRRDVLVAALLHDVVEDTACGPSEVRDRFGPAVAELVDWVTKTDPPPGGDRAEARLGYLRRLASAPPDAVLVKLADRFSNVQKLDRHPSAAKRRSYYQETVEWILPLAGGVAWFHEQYDLWRDRFRHLAGEAAGGGP
jgi:guanosine-3',5'-bis(diphosphate) 3'-pyrophosphohydrolase